MTTITRSGRTARVTLLGLVVAGAALLLPVGQATAAGEGRLVRAEFRGCDVVRVVYSGYRPSTIITWTVSQFGREIDSGAFVSGEDPPAVEQVVTLRLRTPAKPGTDAEFVLDGVSSVRRKPQCESIGTTTVPGAATTSTTAAAPPTTTGSGAGGRPTTTTLPDAIADVIGGPSSPAPALGTRARMIWDDRAFYVAADLAEPHLWSTITAHDAVIFRDHDFEVFVDPDGDTHQYYEFEINARGAFWDL